jgi:hypothetical protein
MLSYESTSKIRPAVAKTLRAEIAAIQRDWWRAPLGITGAEDGFPGFLAGRTALFHAHVKPEQDDLFMAFSDAAFILERLAAWSKEHKIKWHLRMREDDWGAVDPSGLTRPLVDQMQKWSRRAGVFAAGKQSWAVDEARREALLARHAGRKAI